MAKQSLQSIQAHEQGRNQSQAAINKKAQLWTNIGKKVPNEFEVPKQLQSFQWQGANQPALLSVQLLSKAADELLQKEVKEAEVEWKKAAKELLSDDLDLKGERLAHAAVKNIVGGKKA